MSLFDLIWAIAIISGVLFACVGGLFVRIIISGMDGYQEEKLRYGKLKGESR